MGELSLISGEVMGLGIAVNRNAQEQRKQLDRLSEIYTASTRTIEKRLQELTILIAEKTDIETRENLARELIFNIKESDEYLEKEEDKFFIASEAQKLLKLIENYNLTTQTYSQIQDKEYFSKVYGSIKAKAFYLSSKEQEELSVFKETYSMAQKLLSEYAAKEKKIVINVPNDFSFIEMPEEWNSIVFNEDSLKKSLPQIESFTATEPTDLLTSTKIKLDTFYDKKSQILLYLKNMFFLQK